MTYSGTRGGWKPLPEATIGFGPILDLRLDIDDWDLITGWPTVYCTRGGTRGINGTLHIENGGENGVAEGVLFYYQMI